MTNLFKFATIFLFAVEEIKMNVKLTDQEQRIFDLLNEVVKTKTPKTTLRVAGGWVRDKLLGKNSNDIDISIDNMTGEQFANLVKNYMDENHISEKTSDVTVVQANPDQSKHLATAMIKIFGLPIDFVNLRTETYSSSRIPEMQIGTPEEDAQRRDLTINSLFYNINTGNLEDYVGGLDDLRNKIARTPLNPIQTFLDDPLRILRTVRFAAKYNLTLDPELISAANNPEVKKAFKDKISKERIWSELAGKKEGDKWKPGALIGPDPSKAAELLSNLGLLDALDLDQKDMEEIGLSEEMVPWDTDQDSPHHQFSIWGHTLNVVKNLVDQTKQDIKDDHESFIVRNLAALFHDIGKRYKGIHGIHEKGHTTYHRHEDISAKLAERILTNLRAPKDIIARVVKLVGEHLKPHMLMEQGSAKSLRRFVRDFPDWPHSIDLAIADNLGKNPYDSEKTTMETQRYEDLRNRIVEALPGGQVTNIPRPISGYDLIELGIKPGPIMGGIFKEIDESLLENPGMTKEEALEIARKYI